VCKKHIYIKFDGEMNKRLLLFRIKNTGKSKLLSATTSTGFKQNLTFKQGNGKIMNLETFADMFKWW
jgi:hypothetical protein